MVSLCPACSSNIPMDSRFCMNCGCQTAPPPLTTIVREWEYFEFKYSIPRPRCWAIQVSGDGAWTMPAAQLHWWQNLQRDILPQMQNWLDDGWQPVSEVGPGGFKVIYCSSLLTPNTGFFTKVIVLPMLILCIVASAGLYFFLGRETFATPSAFIVQMRRPKYQKN